MAKRKQSESKKPKTGQFRLTYFQPDGRYYHHEVVELACEYDEFGVPVMSAIVAYVRRLRDSYKPGMLPGLIDTWNGHVLVESESRDVPSYPSLVVAEECLGSGKKHRT